MRRVAIVPVLLVALASGYAIAQPADDDRDQDETGPVTKEELLEDPDALVPGTNVFLDDVKVRSTSGNLVRVSVGRRQLFVAPVDPSVIQFLAVGAIIDVHGTLRETPSAAQAKLIYAASGRAAARMARDRVYVDAWSVSTLP